MSCKFISELRRLSKLSAEAVQNLDSFDPIKKYLHVTRRTEADFKDLMQSISMVSHNSDLASLLVSKVQYYVHRESDQQYRYAHIAFYEMLSSDVYGDSQISGLTTGTSLNGLISGVPSVLNEGWYKTGFGMQYAPKSELNTFAALLNAVYKVAFSSSTYTPDHCITTEVSKYSGQQLNKVYSAANWVVFVDPISKGIRL